MGEPIHASRMITRVAESGFGVISGLVSRVNMEVVAQPVNKEIQIASNTNLFMFSSFQNDEKSVLGDVIVRKTGSGVNNQRPRPRLAKILLLCYIVPGALEGIPWVSFTQIGMLIYSLLTKFLRSTGLHRGGEIIDDAGLYEKQSGRGGTSLRGDAFRFLEACGQPD
jgi:hypothetical protein